MYCISKLGYLTIGGFEICLMPQNDSGLLWDVEDNDVTEMISWSLILGITLQCSMNDGWFVRKISVFLVGLWTICKYPQSIMQYNNWSHSVIGQRLSVIEMVDHSILGRLRSPPIHIGVEGFACVLSLSTETRFCS